MITWAAAPFAELVSAMEAFGDEMGEVQYFSVDLLCLPCHEPVIPSQVTRIENDYAACETKYWWME